MEQDQDGNQNHQVALLKKQRSFSEHQQIAADLLSGDEHEQQDSSTKKNQTEKANVLLSVSIIIQSTIGAGIIPLPFAVSRLGVVLSAFLFILFAVFNCLSSILLLKVKNLCGHSNFSTIMYYLWKNKFSKLLGSLLIFVNNMGICLMFLIILKQTIPKIVVDITEDQSYLEVWYLKGLVLVLLLALVELPLTLFKKIQKLKIFSFLGLVGSILFVLGIVAHYIVRKSQGFQGRTMDMYPQDWFQAFAAMPNIILAYAFQMNFFPVYKGLKNSSDRKMNIVSLISTLVLGISFVIVGFLGYALTGRDAKANFLNSIDYKQTNQIVFFVINLGLLLCILLSFAVLFFGCRNNFIAIINLISQKQQNSANKKEKLQSLVEDQQQQQPIQNYSCKNRCQKNAFYIYTIIIYLMIVLLAQFLDDIEVITNLIGALCQNLLATILSTFFYFLCVQQGNKPKTCLYYLSKIVFFILTPLSIWTVICQYI